MYNYNNTVNTAANNTNKNKNNNKMEEIKMNEIKMANILNELDAQGVPVTFSNQVPTWVKNNPEHYAMGLVEGGIPTNIMQKMFAEGADFGMGLMIGLPTVLRTEVGDDNYQKIMCDIQRKLNNSSEFQELINYLRQNPQEGASLVRFCQKCLLAGNVPVRKVVDIVEEDCGEEYLDNSVYFICSNGKVLIRNGEEFEVVYEGVILPNLQTMSDEECLDVIRSAVETYTNLVEPDRDDEDEDYEDDESEDYDDDDDDAFVCIGNIIEDLIKADEVRNIPLKNDLINALRFWTEKLEELNSPNYETRTWIKNILEDIQRAAHNDDIIREQALIDTLEGWIKAYQNQEKEEPKCSYDEDGQQNWIF